MKFLYRLGYWVKPKEMQKCLISSSTTFHFSLVNIVPHLIKIFSIRCLTSFTTRTRRPLTSYTCSHKTLTRSYSPQMEISSPIQKSSVLWPLPSELISKPLMISIHIVIHEIISLPKSQVFPQEKYLVLKYKNPKLREFTTQAVRSQVQINKV